MTAVAGIATDRSRLARRRAVAAIVALGALVVLSPYVWLEEWRLVGFSGAYLPFHLWGLSPFVLLAVTLALILLRRRR